MIIIDPAVTYIVLTSHLNSLYRGYRNNLRPQQPDLELISVSQSFFAFPQSVQEDYERAQHSLGNMYTINAIIL